MTLGTTQGEEVILDTNWYEEGRQLPSVCLMTRSASSAQWSFSSWHLARFLVSKDTDGKTRLTIVTDVSLQHRSLSTDAQTQTRPRPLTWPGLRARAQDDSVRVIWLSEQRTVSVRGTGVMVSEDAQRDEPVEAVALGFARCGAAMRDLLMGRVQHGSVPGDDHLLTLSPRPCDAEMCRLLENNSGVLTMDLLTAFCKGLPHDSFCGTAKEKAMSRLRSAFRKV